MKRETERVDLSAVSAAAAEDPGTAQCYWKHLRP